jgi:hypothetical protein
MRTQPRKAVSPKNMEAAENYSMWEVLAADFFPERPFFS